MLSAQSATQSQWCAARYCPHDANPSGLCDQHERLKRAGVRIELHQTTQPATPDPHTHLWCATCTTHKPDYEFSKKHDKPGRRGRHAECKTCSNERRRQSRLAEDEETARTRRDREARQKRERAHRAKQRRLALRAELQAIRAARQAP